MHYYAKIYILFHSLIKVFFTANLQFNFLYCAIFLIRWRQDEKKNDIEIRILKLGLGFVPMNRQNYGFFMMK